MTNHYCTPEGYSLSNEYDVIFTVLNNNINIMFIIRGKNENQKSVLFQIIAGRKKYLRPQHEHSILSM